MFGGPEKAFSGFAVLPIREPYQSHDLADGGDDQLDHHRCLAILPAHSA